MTESRLPDLSALQVPFLVTMTLETSVRKRAAIVALVTGLAGCSAQQDGDGPGTGPSGARLPLVEVVDVPLQGNPTRFDYQDVDPGRGQLVIAHMGDDSVLIVALADGARLGEVSGVGTVRGVLAAADIGRIFATAEATNELVLIDSGSLTEISRTPTGNGPDGIGWDPVHQVVAVSDQGDGAVSLIANAGTGVRTAVPLGAETGNVVFDAMRGLFPLSAPTRNRRARKKRLEHAS